MDNKINSNIICYLIIILSIIGFIILFICYNEKSIKIYEQSLNKITNMYKIQYYDTNSIVSNQDEIIKRIIFLEERIAHHQNNSNNFASLWLALLSVLFITVTGFNLYNFNESKKRLDKTIDDCNETLKKSEILINELENSHRKNESILNEFNKKNLENIKEKTYNKNKIGDLMRGDNNVS